MNDGESADTGSVSAVNAREMPVNTVCNVLVALGFLRRGETGVRLTAPWAPPDSD